MMHPTTVVSGQGRGRRIGFPTINMAIPDALGTTHGIYAGWVEIRGRRHPAAIHFGPIPTFSESVPTLEAYLIDGPHLSLPTEVGVELVAHIRDIEQFLGAQELAVQIASDVEEVKKVLKTHPLQA